MPKLGYGVFQVSNEECERCVLDAISVGYRSIDTAQSYGNEEAVGSAVQKSGVPREELFLTSKIWMSNAGYEKAKASIDKSLQRMKTDYLDLMLIHQPFGDYYGAYRAMEEPYRPGSSGPLGCPTSTRTGSLTCASLRRFPPWSTRWRPMYSSSKKLHMNI